MSDITVEDLSVAATTTSSSVVVTDEIDSVNVEYSNSALVNVDPHEYCLTSTGIYTGRLDGSVPIWLSDYVSGQLCSNVDIGNNLIIQTLWDRIAGLAAGIHQNLLSIEISELSLNALETALVFRLNGNEAAVIDLQFTKVTADEALAIATNLQTSTFGTDASAYVSNIVTTYASNNLAYASDYTTLSADFSSQQASIRNLELTKTTAAEALAIAQNLQTSTFGTDVNAYIENVTSTYASNNLAYASDHELLTASYSGLSASVSDTRTVMTGTTTTISSSIKPTSPVLGSIWRNTATSPNQWWQYLGGTLGPALDGWVQSTGAAAVGGLTWAGYASSLLTGSDGAITGWQYADGSLGSSVFKVYAQNFQISDGLNSANVPFSILTGTQNRIKFNGIVDFTNTNVYGTTTIDGEKITTGSITADRINTTGLIAENISATTINGKTITGGTISGAIVDGVSITGSHATFDKETGGVSTVTIKTVIANSALVVSNTGSGNGTLSASTSGRGVEGRGGTYDFYAGGTGTNYGPFTGGHDAFILNTVNPKVGDIMSVKGILFKNGVSQTTAKVDITCVEKDTKILGIYVQHMNLNNDLPSMGIDIDLTVLHKMNYISVNSVGEGQINVCSYNENIQNGDYICSSIIPGKGMKQNDDLVHSYTVAKSLEDVVWENESIGVDGCYEIDGYKVKMIACTYHCG